MSPLILAGHNDSSFTHKTNFRFHCFWVFLLICSSTLCSAVAIDDYIDAQDVKYVRIQCIWAGQYLYQPDGSTTVRYSTSVEDTDMRSHWIIRESSQNGRYWIQNRYSGEALHVESQNGNIQISPLKETFTSYRWKFPAESDFFRIQSGWQSSQYISVEDTSTDIVGYDNLVSSWYSLRFRLEPVIQGASVPWRTYDEYNTTATGGGADFLPPTYYRYAIQAEAQNRSAVLLDSYGAFVRWTLEEPADAFTLRYAVPDTSSGGGSDGTISMYVNGIFDRKVDVTSKQAWVYFDSNMEEYDAPGTGRRPAKRYNEARIISPTPLSVGDTIEFRRDSGDRLIWIDLLEAELKETIAPANPYEFYDVSDYGAIPNDGLDDRNAILSCITAAKNDNKAVYIPEGRYELSDKLELSNIQILGAGMWNTELHFTNTDDNRGGINGIGSNLIISDLYMKSEIAERKNYKALRGYWGTGSIIENVWVDQFSVGVWIADYTGTIEETDGLIIRNCRIRNTFADGINLAKGTKNSLVDNCHIRNTGDDSLASWSSDPANVDICKNLTFRYNTIECTYRAAGIGIFGGENHRIHHNVVNDTLAGSGLRFNTTFADNGYPFSSNGSIEVYKNSLYRTGTLNGWGAESGAINLRTRYGNVRNINFKDISIDDVENYGIWFDHLSGTGTYGSFSNINFETINMENVAYGTYILEDAVGSVDYTNVTVSLKSPEGVSPIQNNSSNFTIVNNGGNTGL